MASFPTIDEQFYRETLAEFVPQLIVDQLAQRILRTPGLQWSGCLERERS